MTAAGLHPSVLREYDIRGIIGGTLSVDDYRRIGQAYGSMLSEKGGRTVAVGYDGRLTSPDLERALTEGLASTGLLVLRVGLGPSPMLYFATHHFGCDGGLMVTGSHNPPEYNGLKMSWLGRPFFGADIAALGARVAAGAVVSGAGQIEDRPVANDYADRLIAAMKPGRDLAVAWDPGNGAAGSIVKQLAARLPGRHTTINAIIDGNFPAHHPDPTVESNLLQLKDAVAKGACDLGVAFDGDGDRIGVVDAQGRVVWGDQILLILAREVLADVPGATIIADVKSSQVFFDEVARLGGRPLMSRTGHSLIKTMMVETGAELAGEMSGHIFFAHGYYGFDDALYATIRLLSILSTSDMTLAQMRDAMPPVVNTPELRIDCAEERKFAVVEAVKARLKGRPGITVHDIDGVRVTSEDGWWLLRASNTQPVLVGRCEAASAEGLERLKHALAGELKESGIDPVGVYLPGSGH
jgi:phosphomannomutase